MATTDTQLQQLVINVGTEAQIANAIAGGTITNDMLSIATDGADISYDWIGTLAEYEAQQVATNHPDWLCFITDDVTISNENVYENVYTKAETNELFMAKNDLIAYQPNLLDFKWADHLLNDIQWLRADTFSWQDGSVYEAVYNHLYSEYMAAVTAQGNTPYTETISGITISYYLAEDGHKICPASEESNLSSLFETVGVAWYYLLDTANQRFKLPRTKFGFTGKRDLDAVGKYVAPGLPNITGNFRAANEYDYNNSDIYNKINGVFQVQDFPAKTGSSINQNSTPTGDGVWDITFNASRSNSIYGASTTVQAPATEMYLYFYVGTFLQSAIVNTAGIAAEQLNDLNAHKVVAFQAPTSENNYTWYRKYADGWVEQGGHKASVSYYGTAITFLITMADTNYQITNKVVFNSTNAGSGSAGNKSATGATLRVYGYDLNTGASASSITLDCDWEVCGMAA